MNENWQPEDGGQLVIYNEEREVVEIISPKENRLVIFLSETLHEVKLCSKERKSITGWMLDAPKGVTFIAQ